MDLPIDARTAPIRAKYIDEETPLLRRWFAFGSSSVGTTDIADTSGDIFIGLSAAQADRIVQLREAFVTGILDVLNNKG